MAVVSKLGHQEPRHDLKTFNSNYYKYMSRANVCVHESCFGHSPACGNIALACALEEWNK